MAGAATAFAGSTLFGNKKSEMVSECADNTVVGMLQGIYTKISNIEAVLGDVAQKQAPVKKPGIDIVLGAQWGDEGKGKLVDMLSQVRFLVGVVYNIYWLWERRKKKKKTKPGI